jgi:hypothetical protein
LVSVGPGDFDVGIRQQLEMELLFVDDVMVP